MMTIPPFMSLTPGPVTVFPERTYPLKGLSGSNTVSRCPINSIRRPLPDPVWVAMRCPDRPASAIGLQRTSKPRARNSGSSRWPTARTPAKFMVPELIATNCSNRASWVSCEASTAATIRRSAAESPAADAGPVNASAQAARQATRFSMTGSLQNIDHSLARRPHPAQPRA